MNQSCVDPALHALEQLLHLVGYDLPQNEVDEDSSSGSESVETPRVDQSRLHLPVDRSRFDLPRFSDDGSESQNESECESESEGEGDEDDDLMKFIWTAYRGDDGSSSGSESGGDDSDGLPRFDDDDIDDLPRFDDDGCESESGGDEDDGFMNSIWTAYRDLKFFKMFLWSMAYQEQYSEDVWRFRHAWSNMEFKFMKIAEVFRIDFERASDAEKIKSWEPMSYHLRRKIEQYKPVIREICILVLGGGFIKSCQVEELFLESGENTASLIDLILENLRVLDSTFRKTASAKQQLALVEGKFKVFGKFANHISCHACLYWIGETDGGLVSDMESMLSDLMQKYMPYSTPGVIALYFDVFKARRYHKFGAMRQLAVSYIHFLVEHLVISEVLSEGLVVLSSFVMNELKDNSDENRLLLAKVFDIISDVKIGTMNAVNKTPLSSHFNHSPKTNAVGFLDSFLTNLKKMLERKVGFTPKVKHEVEVVHQQLALIRPLVPSNFIVRMEEEELQDLWNRIINLVHFAAYAIKLCPQKSIFAWYGIVYLGIAVENMMSLKCEIEKIEGGQEYSNRSVAAAGIESIQQSRSGFLPDQATNEGAFIGYKKDSDEILNQLLRGTKDRVIISISGMPGQGKTTLSKRIYNDSSVQFHFHKKVWCNVSKEWKPSELLGNILSEVSGVDLEPKTHDSIDDAANCVRKSLKGKRYLIVLDDVWDVEVWDVVRSSFPNDKNGSRILFTSRNHDLALQAESDSICHRLEPFSDEESRELMKEELFNYEDFPIGFLKIGEQIADLCKGLPLAIALICALLRRVGPVLDLWEQVAENLKPFLDVVGCMDIVWLSYKYLPDHLKSCFLYLGAFPRSKNIHARRLKLLWIAEGFVKENSMQLAEEYLHDLVSHNLVVVTERSSSGGIKECRVHHDLLYDLCLVSAVEDNFLHLAKTSFASGNRTYDFQHVHRLCINDEGYFSLQESTSAPKELPTSQIHTVLFNCFYSQYSGSHCRTLSSFLTNFRVLTVLDLEYLSLPKFRESILYNVHLRYLALRVDMKNIPSSIADLWNLETLILRGAVNVGMPDTLWEMESLKYVDVYCNFILEGAWRKKSILGMAATGNIEVLRGLTLKYDLKTKDVLRGVPRLKKLTCFCEEDDLNIPQLFSMFGSLEKLESLHLRYGFGGGGSYVYKHPPIFSFPDNLKKLSLERGFALPWSAMSMIGKLPNLEVLKLRYGACAGTIWNLGDGEFSKLRFLKLYAMQVEKIDDSDCDDPFPCLEKLFLQHCKRLEEIPSSFGGICTLDTVDAYRCPNVLESVRQIWEQQRDMGNDCFQVYIDRVMMEKNDCDDDNDVEGEE